MADLSILYEVACISKTLGLFKDYFFCPIFCPIIKKQTSQTPYLNQSEERFYASSQLLFV